MQHAMMPAGVEDSLPHLSGPAAAVRQVLAAHFLRGCDHILEIGGHIRPITDFLAHTPKSVLSVDPKTPAYVADRLNGYPCRVRHVPRKFQEVEYDYAPGSYGLVLLGYSLKPYGSREPLGQLLFSLIDNAQVIVLDYSPTLARATSQTPSIVNRPTLRVSCSFDIHLDDAAIAGSGHEHRRFVVLHPKG